MRGCVPQNNQNTAYSKYHKGREKENKNTSEIIIKQNDFKKKKKGSSLQGR